MTNSSLLLRSMFLLLLFFFVCYILLVMLFLSFFHSQSVFLFLSPSYLFNVFHSFSHFYSYLYLFLSPFRSVASSFSLTSTCVMSFFIYFHSCLQCLSVAFISYIFLLVLFRSLSQFVFFFLSLSCVFSLSHFLIFFTCVIFLFLSHTYSLHAIPLISVLIVVCLPLIL